MTQNKYRYRNLARIVIEAKTPLAVGSGKGDLITDQMVARDINGLPYIPGTTIAGILRSVLKIKKYDKSIFGFIEKPEEKKNRLKKNKQMNLNEGSQIIFSSAHIVKSGDKVVEELSMNVFEDENLKHFEELPIRQHVCIGLNGTARDKGKFDEEIVFKGTRFCFEIELLSNEENNEIFKQILDELCKDTIRFGGGTRKGFGEITIVKYQQTELDLKNSNSLNAYLKKSSSLNDEFWTEIKADTPTRIETESITLSLNVKDFILIGSGLEGEKVDNIPVKEDIIIWENGIPQLKPFFILPATSIKGALAHRTDYHYRTKKGVFLDELFKDSENPTIYDTLCKEELFGSVENEASSGNVFVSDVFIPCDNCNEESCEVQPHVVIDAFTGGASKGKLFQEQLLKTKEPILIKIYIASKEYSADVKESFMKAIEDLKNGALALGAATNRGHGTFQILNK